MGARHMTVGLPEAHTSHTAMPVRQGRTWCFDSDWLNANAPPGNVGVAGNMGDEVVTFFLSQMRSCKSSAMVSANCLNMNHISRPGERSAHVCEHCMLCVLVRR